MVTQPILVPHLNGLSYQFVYLILKGELRLQIDIFSAESNVANMHKFKGK